MLFIMQLFEETQGRSPQSRFTTANYFAIDSMENLSYFSND